ncbi:MAG: peptide deformylase, partial [Pseudomonadota bacterium]
MPVRPILRWPDKRLRMPTADVTEITDEIHSIWADMVDTMDARISGLASRMRRERSGVTSTTARR